LSAEASGTNIASKNIKDNRQLLSGADGEEGGSFLRVIVAAEKWEK
jgi:hypothetical protein